MSSAPGSTGGAQRGQSSRALLQMNWKYPVHVSVEAERTDATAVRMRQALSREEALRSIAGDDPRPLLVVRECAVCNKTDDALLTPGVDNERTILLSRWFHCVKLPVDVLQEDHPYNALFPDKSSEHLFVSLRDGSGKLPLESDTSRTQLWDSMLRILTQAYVKDPAAAARDIAKQLDRLDQLDQRLIALDRRRSELMESRDRPDLSKIRKVEDEIAAAKKDIERLRVSIDKLSRIELKPAVAAK